MTCANCAASQADLQALQRDLEEFQDSSREYEAELERDLENKEKEILTLRTSLDRHKRDMDSIRSKDEGTIQTLTSSVSSLQKEVEELKMENGKLVTLTRSLERNVERLEMREREASTLVTTVQEQLEQTGEALAFLQVECEELKSEGSDKEQRMRDQIRDLERELRREKERASTLSNVEGNMNIDNNNININNNNNNSNIKQSEHQDVKSANGSSTSIPSRESSPASPLLTAGSPSLASSRSIQAVNDMLVRVREMEKRLAGCRASLTDIRQLTVSKKIVSGLPTLKSSSNLTAVETEPSLATTVPALALDG